MKKQSISSVMSAFGALSIMVIVSTHQAHAQSGTSTDFVPPKVFQAAGPTISSIQSSVNEFRTALGDPNNLNVSGPLERGRREINWDGGGNNPITAIAGNPFTGFQLTRGAIFTTPNGTGFVQAPPFADPVQFPPGGLVGVFDNPTYAAIFSAFSPLRLFSAIGSNIMEVDFVVPGGDNRPATVTGFGAVFTDVDQPDGSGPGGKHGNRGASTLMEYFGADGALLFSSFVPAAPGDGSLSFFGIVFDDARIAQVRITSGDVAPGPDDGGKSKAVQQPPNPFGRRTEGASGPTLDIVMTDDFIYGEPQPLP